MAIPEQKAALDRACWGWLRLAPAAVLLCFATAAAYGQLPDNGVPPSEASGALGQPLQGAAAAPAEGVAADPPSRVVRVSVLQGNVSAEPSSVNTFSPAELNQVLTTGDRVYTDVAAVAELQAGQIAARLGGGTDLTVTAMTDQLAQFGLASGSVRLHSNDLPAGSVLEVDSPEAAVTVLQPGDLRVDEDAAGHTTTITVLTGQVQVDGPGLSQQLNAGDRVRVHAGTPDTGQGTYAEPLSQVPADALDAFAEARDGAYANGVQASSQYLNPDTTGGADLAAYGSWSTDLDVGPVWFPVVVAGWRPYCDGHWRWVAPWGWTWVGVEPWGFAPFHYGRWTFLDGRWGWIPGTPGLRPVYAPALVTFVGGKQFSASLGYGPASGVAAWFPLGPHEPYLPWYHGSTGYLNRVNASNLYDPNLAEARAFYHQRAVNVFAGNASGAATSREYVNRLPGTVAMSQASFAGGQPVARNQLSIPASELAQAPVLAHPLVSPERWMGVTGTARAVPVQNEHRTFAGSGQGRAGEQNATQEYATRPAFVHAQTPPEPRASFEEQRRAMERTEPGRPVPPLAGAELQRAGRPASAIRDGGARPGGSPGSARPTPPAAAPPARGAEEPARAAPASSSPRK